MNESDDLPRDAKPDKILSPRRLWPLSVLVAVPLFFFAFGLHEHVTPSALATYNEDLKALCDLWWAPLGFFAAYVLIAAFSLPGAGIASIVGGYLFGRVLGTGYVVAAATVGATLLFLVAKSALGDLLRRRAGPAIERLEAGFQENALSYLLVLRLIPVFPFFIVNLVPAFLGVPLRTFAIGTLLGIVPGAFVYASLGAGLESAIGQGEEIVLAGVLTAEVVTALVGLAILALLPVLYKSFKARGGRGA